MTKLSNYNMKALNLCKLLGCKYIDKTSDWRKLNGMWVCKYHLKKMMLDK